MKVAVIGAGASGIIAALVASQKNDVYLFDGNDKCGKKILATGAGHCNYWNSEININKYQTDDPNGLSKIISEENQMKVLDFLDSLGIYPKIKNGYYYPYSNQATSIRQIFEKEINNSGIKFINNCRVLKIKKKDNLFLIDTTCGDFSFDKVIITTGSKAYPKTGSDGMGYVWAKDFGHKINLVLPALTKLITNDKTVKEWENVRTDATVKLYVDDELVKEDTGEIQLSKEGISGICTFNISGLASKSLALNKQVRVVINFLPQITNVYSFLEERSKKLINKTLEEMLESIFNYKLLFILLNRAKLEKNRLWSQLSMAEKQQLVDVITKFSLLITATETFDKSQICTGGVSLLEIDPDTMGSRLVTNLYFAGEVIDVDGMCGGYNLAFAFISGYIAGEALND